MDFIGYMVPEGYKKNSSSKLHYPMFALCLAVALISLLCFTTLVAMSVSHVGGPYVHVGQLYNKQVLTM